ncbi:MAG TPA: fused MFS/spermidine synthase [Xanthobacteraceae bacterium]|nr:fused MFS/spermidine synthase [Xanthobacteraceae bacterium]
MDPNHSAPQRSPAPVRSRTLVLAVFTIAIFTSALLLFAVQPMFTRMVLPRLGGSPSVWSVAMVFFQTMLLGGYAYAHMLMRAMRPPVAVTVHIVLLITAGLTLPLSIARGWGDPPGNWTALWLIGVFATSIGLPFFALAANNPLLQSWFVRSGHPGGRDPYFLYAASNVGSFLALLSYPFILEPTLSLRQHNLLWSRGYWLLFALIVACGYLLLRSPARAVMDEGAAAPASPPPTWRELGRWAFLAAVPSGLLVAVTAYISTDIAAAPLLWVIPLSLYLLTWVLVFQSRPLLPHRLMLAAQPFAIAGIVVLLAYSGSEQLTGLLLFILLAHLIAFFVIAMASHGELARQRPAAEHLTAFYLALAAGGMIGGLFAGLIAPFLFSWVAEYPILLVLAALCRPLLSHDPALRAGAAREGAWQRRDGLFWTAAVALGLALLVPGLVFGWVPQDEAAGKVNMAIAVVAVLSLLLMRRPFRAAFAVAIALAMVRLYPGDEARTQTVRSFFGVHKIYDTPDGIYRVLMHGTTIHGAQKLTDGEGKPLTGRPQPLTYYHAKSPMAEIIRAVRNRKGAMRVAVIGLGSGSLACYLAPGEEWRFFEIDPAIVDIARDHPRFSFVGACAPNVPIVLGDARLTLAREPDRHYDLIIVDAYSSDAIPVHLATREAMAVYKSKLKPDGIVTMHISNLYLDLEEVAVGIASANGMTTWINHDSNEEESDEEYIFESDVAISANRAEDLGELIFNENWKLTGPDARQRAWTDDYANIVGAIAKRANWPRWSMFDALTAVTAAYQTLRRNL